MDLEKLIGKSKGFEVEDATADTKSYIKMIDDIKLIVIRELDKISENKYLIPLVVFDGSEVFVLYNPIKDDRFSYSLNITQKKAIHNLKDIEEGIPVLRFEEETRKTGECIVEYPEGTLLSEYHSFSDEVPSDFFDQLSGLVEKIHNKGVANIGLDKQHTLLLRYRHEPLFLGFENSVSEDDKFFGWLYDLAQRTDRYNLLRLKQEFRPEQLASAEIRELEKGLNNNPPFEKLQSQLKIKQLVDIGKRKHSQNPLLSYASFLVESIIRNYPRGERILQG